MTFNARAHRDTMHALTNYVAAATFIANVGWGQDGSANILNDIKTKEDAVVIIIGKIVKDRVYCGPAGNWTTGNRYGSLKTAKYTFALCKPDEDCFADDFETAFKMLGKLQSKIASTTRREHLLLGEGEKIHNIRLTADVFEERDVPVQVPLKDLKGFPKTVYEEDFSTTPPPDALDDTPSDRAMESKSGNDSDNEIVNVLDNTTANWPVPKDMVDDLHDLMGTHKVQPLPVYKDDIYVEPLNVNAALKGALVEVHFSIKHYRIKDRAADRLTDSFTGHVEQIVILKDGVPKGDNAYKRKNLLDKPFRPKPFVNQSAKPAANLTDVPKVIGNSSIVGPSNTSHDDTEHTSVTPIIPATSLIEDPVVPDKRHTRKAGKEPIAGPSGTSHQGDTEHMPIIPMTPANAMIGDPVIVNK